MYVISAIFIKNSMLTYVGKYCRSKNVVVNNYNLLIIMQNIIRALNV